MLETVRNHRRALHQIPEIGFDLPKTLDYVKGVLAPLSCEVTFPAQSAVCAFFDAGSETTLALRADMDALPIQEVNDVPYRSTHEGKMHACGHDAHTAMLLTLAQELDRTPPRRNVLLVFQPAEETVGGAKPICDSGVFERYHVDAILALHVFPGGKMGAVEALPGPAMAGSVRLNIEIDGKSAHASRFREGHDAMEAGARFLLGSYEIADRYEGEHEFILRYGKMESGTVVNAVSAHTKMEGSLRYFTDECRELMFAELRALEKTVERQTGCTFRNEYRLGYPPVVNDEGLCARLHETLGISLNAPKQRGSEDFSFYQKLVPGVMLHLCTGREATIHGCDFDLDEQCLVYGVQFFLDAIGKL